MLPYRYIVAYDFGEMLSPGNYRRYVARPVSYYALFK